MVKQNGDNGDCFLYNEDRKKRIGRPCSNRRRFSSISDGNFAPNKNSLKEKLAGNEIVTEDSQNFQKVINNLCESGLNAEVSMFWLKYFAGKIVVGYGEFLDALRKEKIPDLNKENIKIWFDYLDAEATGYISVYELKILEKGISFADSLNKLIKKKYGVGKLVEVRGWNETNGWTLEKSWMKATIVDATNRKVALKQSSGSNQIYWRKRDEIRPLGGIQKGVPLEIHDSGGWFTTEIINVVDDDTVYLDDVGESGYSINEPISIGNLEYRLLGHTYSFNKQKVPEPGNLIQVNQLNNSYAKKFVNVQGGLPQWFDAVVEEVLKDGKIRVTYCEEIQVDEDEPLVDQSDEDGMLSFASAESTVSERANKVELVKCRPFRCIGIGEEVEVEHGENEEVRFHFGNVTQQKGKLFEVKLRYEDKTILTEANKIRPLPYIRCNAWNFAPDSFTAIGGRTSDGI